MKQNIWINILVWITLVSSAISGTETALKQTFIATECFGNVLSLSCKRGHRIKVLDDFFGVSERTEGKEICNYKLGDCTVTNNRYTSVIHRYCEGKQSCTNFQVDRRYCGINQTNYEQVEYGCVPDSEVSDFCIPSNYTAEDGYIATPNFPQEYPPNLHCSCRLTTDQNNARIQLESTYFLVKFDDPCQDWVDITTSSGTRRRCGAYRSTLLSNTFQLTFHSDEKEGHQGIWLHYSVIPEDSTAKITVECKPEIFTSTTEMPTTTIATTTTPDYDYAFVFDTTTKTDAMAPPTTTPETMSHYDMAVTTPSKRIQSTNSMYPDVLDENNIHLTTTPQHYGYNYDGDTNTEEKDSHDEVMDRNRINDYNYANDNEKPQNRYDYKYDNKKTQDGFENGAEYNAMDHTVRNIIVENENSNQPNPRKINDYKYENQWNPYPTSYDLHPTYKGRDEQSKGRNEQSKGRNEQNKGRDEQSKGRDEQRPHLNEVAKSRNRNKFYKYDHEDEYGTLVDRSDNLDSGRISPTSTESMVLIDASSDGDNHGYSLEVEEEEEEEKDDPLEMFKDTDDFYDSQEVGGGGYKGKTNGRNLDAESRKRINRTTGVIIISICVGGILLLIAILSILLCISKRKRPEVKEKQKKEKLQERLNSLSFYDSIPMYESIGRRGGVARCPPVANAPNTNGSPGKNMAGESPYWTNIQASPDIESDHDSAIYAELDKHSSQGGSSHGGTPPTLPKSKTKRQAPAPPPPKNNAEMKQQIITTKKGQEEPYALDLGDEDSEAVYTHV